MIQQPWCQQPVGARRSPRPENKLAPSGHEIGEGRIVPAGSLTQSFFVSPGDSVEVRFSHPDGIHLAIT